MARTEQMVQSYADGGLIARSSRDLRSSSNLKPKSSIESLFPPEPCPPGAFVGKVRRVPRKLVRLLQALKPFT